MPSLDVFKSDAFGVITMTDAVNKMPFVPGRVGELGIFQELGVTTTVVMIEERDGRLALVPASQRGAPAAQQGTNKRKARSITVPHLTVEDTIMADEVQNVRAFGSDSETDTIQRLTNQKLGEMTSSLDATLEYHRIGALKGTILDSDGSTTLVNLFTEFGVTQETEIDFDLDNASPANGAVRTNINKVIRKIQDNLGAAPYRYIHCLCGSTFFDQLVAHKEVTDAYARWTANGQMGEFLRTEVARRSFPYGGLIFEEYRGSVGSVNFVDALKAHFFPVGSPGLFKTYFAPADFIETVNTLGLPRYAKVAVDDKFQRWVDVHTQSNPLSICTRPKVLMLGKNT